MSNYTNHPSRKGCEYPKQSLSARFEEQYMPEPNSGCWLWLGQMTSGGYGNFWISDRTLGQFGAYVRAHRASWLLFRSIIPKDVWVLHKCDNRACVNPDHLYLGDRMDNMRDAIARHRRPNVACANNPNARLTPGEVQEVRQCSAMGVSRAVLARRFGVNWTTINNIAKHRTWQEKPT